MPRNIVGLVIAVVVIIVVIWLILKVVGGAIVEHRTGAARKHGPGPM